MNDVIMVGFKSKRANEREKCFGDFFAFSSPFETRKTDHKPMQKHIGVWKKL
jgi:hypothetical protein